LKPKTVSLVSFGCAKNLVDSEVMLGYLSRAGYSLLPDPESADVVILNTCGFIAPAKEEAARALEEAAARKRKNGRGILVAAGCYVERYERDLKSRYPEVDVWLGVKDFDRIVQAVEGRPYRRRKDTFLCGHVTPRLLSTPPSWAYLKVSEGCSHRCAFCAIPLIKGPYRSRSAASIVQEAREMGRRGVKEINLVSQDTTYFGRDRGRRDGLAGLLRKLSAVREIRWIRLLYGYPEEVTAALLEVMSEEKVCPYLDLPFQHAHPRVLKGMKRSMSAKKALALIEKIRKRLPEVSLRTSLIVGFPGEGRREFRTLMAFVKEARFDHLGVFTYSPEEGTKAFSLGDTVSESEKLARRAEIMNLQAEISLSINRKYLNRRLEVVIEEQPASGRLTAVGRTRFQAPEVDGVVYLRNANLMAQRLKPVENVEIVAAGVYDLRGKIIR
jgi:ribosomal protein S12 methylthiotransferase